jgi:nucleotide-binding universal stress UspA family protein
MLFSNILVAYDGSNLSKKALSRAVGLVQESKDPLHAPTLTVLHVAHVPVYAYAASAAPFYSASMNLSYSDAGIEDEIKRQVPDTLKVHYAAAKGSPAHSILEYAEKHGNDLIVMGSRGLGPIREFFLGSVSHNVVQNSKIPVLIVK